MRIAAWNVNHRVGKTRYQSAAPDAIVNLPADVVVITEYFPRQHEEAFLAKLRDGGLIHQVSTRTDVIANRVLIASRVPLEEVDLKPPDFDRQFRSNVCGVRIPSTGFTLIGVRVPYYEGNEVPLCSKAWDWILGCASDFEGGPTIIIGDFNANAASGESRGGAHFRHLLKRGWKHAHHPGRSYQAAGPDHQIDHLLFTPYAKLLSSRLLESVNGYDLCVGGERISDHAAIVAELEGDARYAPVSNAHLYDD